MEEVVLSILLFVKRTLCVSTLNIVDPAGRCIIYRTVYVQCTWKLNAYYNEQSISKVSASTYTHPHPHIYRVKCMECKSMYNITWGKAVQFAFNISIWIIRLQPLDSFHSCKSIIILCGRNIIHFLLNKYTQRTHSWNMWAMCSI